MKSSGVAGLLAVLVLSSLPWSAQAASFNCRTAERPDEILICQNPRLSKLDEDMSSLYFRVRNRLAGAARRKLESDQREWLDSRISCGRDYNCIESHYQTRIAQLRRY